VDASSIRVLVAVRESALSRFQENLSKEPKFKLTLVTSIPAARAELALADKHTDALVVDNGLGGMYEIVKDIRATYPRLWVVMVDEEADFGMPGRADEVSTEPFKDADLIKKIKRLAEERRLETLHADTLAPVKSFARSLSKASKGGGKQQSAVETIKQLGYDYVVLYSVTPTEPPSLSLSAQIGPGNIMSLMSNRADYTGVLGWVVQNGQSRVIGPGDDPSHILIQKGKFGAAACIPVGSTIRFGVILACKEHIGTISQENVMMLELIGQQLAAALAKEART
jgi:hypothetical protein